LFAAIFVLLLLPCGQALYESLYVSVHVDRTYEDGTAVLLISGHVTRLNQSSVSFASVSIQVTDPYGSSVHVAFIHSDDNGSYSDTLQLSSDRAAGNYTIYVTASKPGFEDGHAKVIFSIVVASLSLNVFPNSATVEQGESATFTVQIETRYSDLSPISIEVSGLPVTFFYDLSSNVAIAPSTIRLTVQSLPQTSPGSYSFTVIGVSAEGEAKANAEIIVRPRALPEYLVAASILIVTLLVILFYGLSRRRSSKKKTTNNLAPSPEYLEGLTLSPSTLLTLPDHLRKTAVILCQLGEATAADVASRSGRARAAESDYLNQLARMGVVRKKRKGRESCFSVQ